MCGVNGFNFRDAKETETSERSYRIRGPDDEGIVTDQAVSIDNVRPSTARNALKKVDF
ncbi:MAG: hypothetical protein ACLP5V_11605 [Candidatus Bathyarchaeia archaeon]